MTPRQFLVDDAWLRKERKRIEDLYTFQIDNFGRVILREDRKDFDVAVTSFLRWSNNITRRFAQRWTPIVLPSAKASLPNSCRNGRRHRLTI